MIIKKTMTTNGDRYVTPAVTVPPGAKVAGLHIPKVNDATEINIEISPLNHAFNYPATPGGYAANNVVFEMRMDDADGNTITDQVNNVQMTEQGNPTFQESADTAGLGNGLAFDGTGDAFDKLVQDIPAGILPTTGDFSVEVVCDLTSGSGGAGDTIISCRTGADGVGWQLQLDANEYLDVHIEDADGQVAQEGATDIADDEIKHIVCSFDRDGNLVTYIDGASNATTDISSKEKTILPATGASNRLSIGGDAARTAGDCLTGTIYFVRIYNKALSAAEVLDNYNTLMGKGYPGWAELIDPVTGNTLTLTGTTTGGTFYDLTQYLQNCRNVALRVKCVNEQTTSATDLTFGWQFG